MFLCPENRNVQIDINTDRAIIAFLWKRCFDDSEKTAVHKSFYAFRANLDSFKLSTANIHKDDPLAFWQTFIGTEEHKYLARIAVTIFETPANSVASERAFSCIGLVTNALRNRLLADRATKLIYIHMNQRILDENTLFQDLLNGSEEDQVELEKMLTQMDEEGIDFGQSDDEDMADNEEWVEIDEEE